MRADIETLLAQLYHPELKVIDPGLDRVVKFLNLLGSPHTRLPPVIHVAGTNGKGSLVAFLQAIFIAAGYHVHRYTSPHLIEFNERIVIDGKPITDDYLVTLLHTISGYIKNSPLPFLKPQRRRLFLAFSAHPADIILLETGMGGRLDATNIIDQPLLTAITPIGIDHSDFLGETVAQIASEKAGILKHNVPCVVGLQDSDAAFVIASKAQDVHAPLYRMKYEWQIVQKGIDAIYQSPKRTVKIRPALAGAYQIENAATAVACIDLLTGFEISNDHIEHGLQHVIWPARLQPLKNGHYANILPPGIRLWLDGSHNPHGAKALAQWFTEQSMPIYVICGMIKGKDSGTFLHILSPYITTLYAITIPGEPLSQPAKDIAQSAQNAGVTTEICSTIENALQTIGAHAKTPSIVCICGSLYLAGKVLAQIKDET